MNDDVLADLKAAAAAKWRGDPAAQQWGLFARAAAEIERLRADAARYRWLRSMFEERGDCWWLDAVLIEGAPSLETLEDAIDAAMKDAP